MNRDLTPEGQLLLESILKYDDINRGREPTLEEDEYIPPQLPKLNKWEKDLYNTKLEIAKMIANSRMVVEDCNEILAKVETIEDYIKSDAKVAKTVHLALIDRLERVIAGLPAFDNEDHLQFKMSKLRALMMHYVSSK